MSVRSRKSSKPYKTLKNQIIETATNFVIYKISDKKERATVLEMLNNGTGFEGSTPPFFLNPPMEK